MKEEIESILALDITGTCKLILIYFKLNGAGCISHTELSRKLNCTATGLNRSIKKLSELKYLEVDSKTYKQSHYKLPNWLSGEDLDTTCDECHKSTGKDRVISTNGIFCDNKCHAKCVLDTEQFEEIYGKQ